MFRLICAAIALTFSLLPSASAQQHLSEQCIYRDHRGVITVTNRRESIPDNLRAQASCHSRTVETSRSSPTVALDNNKTQDLIKLSKRATFNSPLGVVELQWDESTFFEQSAQSSVISAWRAATKTLSQKHFPLLTRFSNYNWKVFILSGKSEQLHNLKALGGCHPGWMTPPATIFIASTSLATRCGTHHFTPSQAQDELTRVLLHELGHAVEFQLLGRPGTNDRFHSEGFAELFSTLALELYDPLKGKAIKLSLLREAQAIFRSSWSPKQDFKGSAEDYRRVFGMMSALIELKGLRRLIDIYEELKASRAPFLEVVRTHVGWSEFEWSKQTFRYLQEIP
jgi:hypothetical protein